MNNLMMGEQLQHSTLKIDTNENEGTGFICGLNVSQNNPDCLVVVTNRHVIQDQEYAKISLVLEGKNGEPDFDNIVSVCSYPPSWMMHPDDSVDLAIIALTPLLQIVEGRKNRRPFFSFISENLMADSSYYLEMDAFEKIVMLGHPIGLSDKKNNLPIARTGMTASRVSLGFEGEDQFLIDCPCFPGSSGSPVFHFDIGPRMSRNGSIGIGDPRVKLLGILTASVSTTVDGEIVPRPINMGFPEDPIVKSNTFVNLGYCTKVTQLSAFKSKIAQVFKDEALKAND